MKCPLCVYDHENLASLSSHFRKRHKSTAKQFYILSFCNGVEPTCECGCGVLTKFWDVTRGFSKFKHGHAARVKNNWGHNEDAKQKSQAVRREMHKNGEIIVWNKGLSVETDDRVAAYGKQIAESYTQDMREHLSKTMTKNRLSRVVPTLLGAQHSQWKGGVSSIQDLSRSYLYKVWIFPKLKLSNFTCSTCKTTKDLQVHHDKERFAEILQKARLIFGDLTDQTDFELKVKYATWVSDYHVENDVSGIVLCESCHKAEHKSFSQDF